MTTIACNKEIMCGDTLMCDGGMASYIVKIFSVKGSIIGISGSVAEGLEFIEWYKDKRKKKPQLTEDFNALVLTKDGIEGWENNLIPIPIKEAFYAIGSGRDYAMSAMSLNEDPAEAVAVACEYDIYSRGPIIQITLHKVLEK